MHGGNAGMYGMNAGMHGMNGGAYGGMGMMGANMQQMQMMSANAMQAMGGPGTFYFIGTAQSLQGRLDSMSDEQVNQIVDANISVTGVELQPFNMTSYCCTTVWGGIILLPLFFMCCDWWKRCTYPAYEIPLTVYESMGRLFRGGSLRNVSLTVTDNCFEGQKASILYNCLASSRLSGFTFINQAGAYNYNGREHSDFEKNMGPIKSLTNIISDIRWNSNIYC